MRELPLVALSASASREVSEQMREAGINRLVVKPFRPEQLHAAIREAAGYQSPPEKTPPVVLSADLREMFEGDEEGLREFRRTVAREIDQLDRDFRAGLEESDVELLRDALHKVHTALRLFGQEQLREDLSRVIQLVDRDNLPRAMMVHELAGKKLAAFRRVLA